MHRYTPFAVLLALFLVLMVVETVNSQVTIPPATSTALTTTNQVTITTPLASITTTNPITAIVPITTTQSRPISGSVVGANVLNVRSGPGINFTRIITLTDGSAVAILGRDSTVTWLQIQLSGGEIGWVSGQYVRSNFLLAGVPVISTGSTPTTGAGGTGGAAIAQVNTTILNVRSGPGLTFVPITTLTQGQTVSLLGRNADNTWLQVGLSDGRAGWVSSQFVIANLTLSTLPLTASQ